MERTVSFHRRSPWNGVVAGRCPAATAGLGQGVHQKCPQALQPRGCCAREGAWEEASLPKPPVAAFRAGEGPVETARSRQQAVLRWPPCNDAACANHFLLQDCDHGTRNTKVLGHKQKSTSVEAHDPVRPGRVSRKPQQKQIWHVLSSIQPSINSMKWTCINSIRPKSRVQVRYEPPRGRRQSGSLPQTEWLPELAAPAHLHPP